MKPIPSLVLTLLLSMKTLANFAINNNFDGRYPWVERVQEEPGQLAFEVPCKHCIFTTKQGYSYRPLLINMKSFDEYEQHPVLSEYIPLSKVFRKYYNNKRKNSSRPEKLPIIKSTIHELNHYIRKNPKALYKRRWWNEKMKHNLSPHPERRSITRTRHHAHTQRTRSNRVHVLPKRTTIIMYPIPIATDNKLMNINKYDKETIMASSHESEATTLKVKENIKITDKPFKLRTKVVEDKIKLYESFPKALSTEKLRFTAQKSQEKTALPQLLPVASTGLLSETHDETLMPKHIFPSEGIKKYIIVCSTSTEIHHTDTIKCELTPKTSGTLMGEKTTQIEPVAPIFKSNSQSNATRIIKYENRNKPLIPFVTKGYIDALIQKAFAQALDHFEIFFYNATLKTLSSINPPDRRENGISFVQSGLFLYSFLSAIYLEVRSEIQQELKTVLGLDNPAAIKTRLNIIRHVINSLPPSGEDLKLRWSTRLIVNGSWTPSTPALDTLFIAVEHINATATPEQLTVILNQKVEEDSGGAMRNTFDEDELAEGVSGVLLNTLYFRARWRSAPTLLNGTRLFREAPESKPRATRMIRINDIMQYAPLPHWDAEAVEIPYSTPGLSLLLLVPRGRSLRNLSALATEYGLKTVYHKMRTLRVAVTMPIYTLRMTLLLTNKLQAMGLSHLVDAKAANAGDLRLSHAVQRIMFWAEAGRNAFKDDGFEWDEAPQLEMLVDRPYLFYVRWRNLTLMNGNFVL